MGYRSEVAFTLSHKAKEDILLKGKSSLCEEDYELLESILSDEEADAYHENESGVYVHHHNMKWYADYPEISLIETYISEHPEEAALFRIGEDYTDVEHYGMFDEVKRLMISSNIIALDAEA